MNMEYVCQCYYSYFTDVLMCLVGVLVCFIMLQRLCGYDCIIAAVHVCGPGS